jgi:Protein of unknown function (DUF2905)
MASYPLDAKCNRRQIARVRGSKTMARFLIALGIAILIVGLLWPYLSRIGLGRLPGDIVIERDNVTLYFPLMTCLLLSLLFSLVFWVASR